MSTLNYSKQREAIYNFLMTRKDHPTAEVVYQNVRKDLPNISFGTVYRNLGVLSETGQIRKLQGAGNVDHFDADTSPHSHFICNCCSKVDDIFGELDTDIDKEASKLYDGQITMHDIYYFGICKECLNK